MSYGSIIELVQYNLGYEVNFDNGDIQRVIPRNYYATPHFYCLYKLFRKGIVLLEAFKNFPVDNRYNTTMKKVIKQTVNFNFGVANPGVLNFNSHDTIYTAILPEINHVDDSITMLVPQQMASIATRQGSAINDYEDIDIRVETLPNNNQWHTYKNTNEAVVPNANKVVVRVTAVSLPILNYILSHVNNINPVVISYNDFTQAIHGPQNSIPFLIK
jgi:hypothetical protein